MAYRFVAALMLVGFVACLENVVRLSMMKDEQIPQNNYAPKTKVKLMRLGAFQFKNCGDASRETFVISKLSLTPDPIRVPGTVTLNFTGVVSKTVDSPLKVGLVLEKNVFGEWLKLPCWQSIGSCTYDDLCSILSPISSCPAPFVKQNVPCKCPFNKGSYSLTNAGIDIPVYDEVPVGDYRATANMTMNGQFVGCYFIAFTLAN